MKKVFISGCYDILHGRHIQFFKEAPALGDHKRRRTSLPQGHKLALMTALDIVDCAITPTVSLNRWAYEQRPGLGGGGGGGAWSLLDDNDGVESERNIGVGWQDPAIVRETGLCAWRSGALPVLDFKRNGDFLPGHMALHYTGISNDAPANADKLRDYDLIEKAGTTARDGVFNGSITLLGKAIQMSYAAQIKEGMSELADAPGCVGRKYCGGDWGGYALFLFEQSTERDAFVSSATRNRAIKPSITIR